MREQKASLTDLLKHQYIPFKGDEHFYVRYENKEIVSVYQRIPGTQDYRKVR